MGMGTPLCVMRTLLLLIGCGDSGAFHLPANGVRAGARGHAYAVSTSDGDLTRAKMADHIRLLLEKTQVLYTNALIHLYGEAPVSAWDQVHEVQAIVGAAVKPSSPSADHLVKPEEEEADVDRKIEMLEEKISILEKEAREREAEEAAEELKVAAEELTLALNLAVEADAGFADEGVEEMVDKYEELFDKIESVLPLKVPRPAARFEALLHDDAPAEIPMTYEAYMASRRRAER